MKKQQFYTRRQMSRWLLAVTAGITILIISHAVPAGFASLAYAQQEPGEVTPGQTKRFTPPDAELAMKIKEPFVFAGVGDIIDHHPIGQLADPAFQGLIKHLRDADVAMANMEGTVIDFDNFPTPIYDGMPKAGLADLKAMGIRVMNRANNHTLENGFPGMFETSRLLDEAGIVHAGVGRNLQEARAASFLSTSKGTVGIIGMFSIDPSTGPNPAIASSASYRNGDLGGIPGLNGLHVTPYFVVTADQMEALRKIRDSVYERRSEVPDPVPPLPSNEPPNLLQLFGTRYKVGPKPGDVNYVMNPQDEREILRSIRNGKENADFLIVTIHCHQANYAFQIYSNDNDVPDFLVELAHKAIDNGADVFIAHGVHTIRGVEIYKGKPIFYGVSNFVNQIDQMAEPPNPGGGDMTDEESTHRPGHPGPQVTEADNLEALLVTAKYDEGKLAEVRVYPADLGRQKSRVWNKEGIPMTPSPENAKEILEKLQRISKPFGTSITIENNVGVIHITQAPPTQSGANRGGAQ